jgi:hypothetical protein
MSMDLDHHLLGLARTTTKRNLRHMVVNQSLINIPRHFIIELVRKKIMLMGCLISEHEVNMDFCCRPLSTLIVVAFCRRTKQIDRSRVLHLNNNWVQLPTSIIDSWQSVMGEGAERGKTADTPQNDVSPTTMTDMFKLSLLCKHSHVRFV